MKSYKSKVALINEEELSKNNNRLKLLEEYQRLTLDNELELMRDFFEKSKIANNEKLEELVDQWRYESDTTYKDLCDSFIKEFKVK